MADEAARDSGPDGRPPDVDAGGVSAKAASAGALFAKIISLVALAYAVLASIVMLVIAFFVVGRFEEMFIDMEIPGGMPLLTRMAISPAFPVIVLIMMIAAVAKEFLLKNLTARILANVAYLVVIQVMAILVVFSLFLPMMKLIEGVTPL